MVDDDTALVQFAFANDEDAPNKTQSLAISSYVTCWAMMNLFNLLNSLHTRKPGCLLYTDTDSCIYVENLDQPLVKTGEFLGMLTDEIKGQCVRAAFGGPKAYILELKNGELSECLTKIKGIKLTSEAASLINIEKFTDMCKSYYENIVRNQSFSNNQEEVEVTQNRICSDKQTQRVTSYDMIKRFRITSEKRRVVGNETLPFGYVIR